MAVPTLLIVAVSVFVLIRLIPGDPASLMLGDLADPASLADLRQRLGLDQSLPVQFVIWFGNVLQGDLGQSITSQPAGAAAGAGRASGSARRSSSSRSCSPAWSPCPPASSPPGGRTARSTSALVGTATLLLSIPTFWLGLLLLLFFGLKLEWLPVVGYVSIARGSRRRLCSTSSCRS